MDIDPARGATPYQRCGEVIDLCRASAPLFNVANSLNYCICHDQYFGARVLSSQYLPHCGGTRWSSVALGLPCRSGSWKPLGLRVAPVNNALTTVPQCRQYHLLKPCMDSISRGLWFEHSYSGSDPFYKLAPSLQDSFIAHCYETGRKTSDEKQQLDLLALTDFCYFMLIWKHNTI